MVSDVRENGSKVTFISFQTLRNDIATGMVKFLLPLHAEVSHNKAVEYYVGDARTNSDKYKNIKTVSSGYFYISKIVDILASKSLFKRFLAKKRYYMEVLFDYFCSKKLDGKTYLVASCYLPKTFAKNRQLGGKNVFIAGNPCEFAIRKELSSLEAKFDIKISDVYTDSTRLAFIRKSYEQVDELMLFTESQRSTYTSSYSDKAIFYRETFIKPNAKLFPETNVTKSKQFTFCYIAHSVWLKGLTVLLDAWKESRPVGAKLLIGGDIESGLKKSIEERYRNIEGVQFLGRVEDLNLFFRESHVCVVPSLLDAGPATVAESLSCGTPVICSDGCGSSTLVTGPFGQVFKSGSEESLAKALHELSSNYENYSFTSKDFAAESARIDVSDFHTAAATYILEGAKQ